MLDLIPENAKPYVKIQRNPGFEIGLESATYHRSRFNSAGVREKRTSPRSWRRRA